MSVPFMGSADIVVLEVRDIDIHGSRYYDVVYELVNAKDRQPQVARVGTEIASVRPMAGQQLTADFAMRQIIALRPTP
jgi:hypothetical protein